MTPSNAFIFAFLTSLDLLAVTPLARAADDAPEIKVTYTTIFSFTRIAPDGQLTIAGDISSALPISLPPTMHGWTCQRNPQRGRGNLIAQSITCEMGGFQTGMGVSCPTDDTGSDDETFWIHPTDKNKSGVLFVGHCTTIRNRAVDDGF